jgi:hypothetical protein
MTPLSIGRTAAFAVILLLAGAVHAQVTPARPEATAPAVMSAAVLKGTWVRPDGGYRIVVDGIEADGKLNATYFNPSRLPFATAQVSQQGGSFRVVLELQAGGYAGSTYDLVYQPATDRLVGTFYQAVARQKFDVTFIRR